jgi:hypothetical protein
VPTQFQICYPYSLFRTTFPIAVGLNIGIYRLGFKASALQFADNELTNIAPDAGVKKALERHWYTGISLLKTIKISQPLRMLAGPSFLLNYNARLRQKNIGGPDFNINTSKYIRRISVPLNIQINYSQKQLLGVGVWARIPTNAVFNGNAYKDLKQFQVGISGTIIF